jgi:alcohol dehydrogenase class IV
MRPLDNIRRDWHTPFQYEGQPGTVWFGRGERRRIGEALERLEVRRVAILSGPRQAGLAEEIAGGLAAAAIYGKAAMHTPVAVTQDCLGVVAAAEADGILSIGGGSAIGLGKAVAVRTGLPHLVIPTTFAGSEMSPILGETKDGIKTTRRSPAILPEMVIYDADLLASLPPAVAGPSAMNAMAHAVEALYAEAANPLISLLAEESIHAMGQALPNFLEDAGAMEAWEQGFYASWLAGICLGSVGMALHHKICHTLGGAFDLPHADLHCLILPYAAAYNREAAPRAMARVARALGVADAPAGLYALMQQAATRRSLKAFGLTEADLDTAADLAVRNPYHNPRPVTRDGVRAMLQAAYEGGPP